MENKDMLEKLQKQQCLEYFRDRSVYRKLFGKLWEKYESLGHFGGTVRLTGLTAEEKQQLGGFLQKDYTENKTVTVSAALLEKALSSSRFSSLSWEEILESYYGKKPVGKKEQKLQENQKCRGYFEDIMKNGTCREAAEWLGETLTNRTEGYLFLIQKYKENPVQLKENMNKFMLAASRISVLRNANQKELLPVFAAQTTGNPHEFDEGTDGEKLLSFFLKWHIKSEEQQGLAPAEYRKKLFFEGGILKDELSNDVLAYGIRGWKADGTLHEGIEGFFRCGEEMKLTLKSLEGLEEVCGREANVYVVENPAVFSFLVEKYPKSTFVCGNGQLRLAVLLLLDKLAKQHTLYYAGDFDPEGLLIAQNLKNRYGEKAVLWNYRRDLYEGFCSEILLDSSRLRKLEKIDAVELQEIKAAILFRKRAAYQETMIEAYCIESAGENTVESENTPKTGFEKDFTKFS